MQCAHCSTPLPDNSRYCLSCGADLSGDPAEATLQIGEDPELESMLQEDLHGDYIIEEMVQRGGMAAVFLARDANLNRKVAIKVLPPELTHGPGMAARFKAEARTAATLDHPHIVPIYRISTSGRLFWYVMKFIDGESLAQVLEREGPLSPAIAANIINQVADALDFAHRKGVVHRDIKPDNIMIDQRGWVTVMDFGIAKALDRPGVTGPGSMLGTPYYMAPEQGVGGGAAPASDQYSLGVAAYRMLANDLPFHGDTVLAVVRAHATDPVPPLAPSVPAPLAAAVYRALAKKPEERFADVVEFADAFGRAARATGGVAQPFAVRRGGTRPRTPSRTGITPQYALPNVATPKPGLRLPSRRWLVAGAATTVVVAAALLLSPRRPAAHPPAAPSSTDTTVTPSAVRAGTAAHAPPPVVTSAATGYITVGSEPLAKLSINGRAMPGNPVADFAVPPGPVRLHFDVRDAAGTWAFDTTVTIGPGEHRILGRIHLVRPAR